MDTSMILASYALKAQSRSVRGDPEAFEPGLRNGKRVITRLARVLQWSVSSPSK